VAGSNSPESHTIKRWVPHRIVHNRPLDAMQNRTRAFFGLFRFQCCVQMATLKHVLSRHDPDLHMVIERRRTFRLLAERTRSEQCFMQTATHWNVLCPAMLHPLLLMLHTDGNAQERSFPAQIIPTLHLLLPMPHAASNVPGTFCRFLHTHSEQWSVQQGMSTMQLL